MFLRQALKKQNQEIADLLLQRDSIATGHLRLIVKNFRTGRIKNQALWLLLQKNFIKPKIKDLLLILDKTDSTIIFKQAMIILSRRFPNQAKKYGYPIAM